MSEKGRSAGPVGLGSVLDLGFYARTADIVAPALLGKLLLVQHAGEPAPRVGRIVETEAYVGEDDLACHGSKGLTGRTSTIFGPPGRAYVYLIYGMYDMFNVVAAEEGVPHAVLVRAAEPLGDSVQAARTDGPGRLTKALGITRAAHNGVSLLGPDISIRDGPTPDDIAVTARVGVAYAGTWADAPLRFYDAGSRCVSRPGRRQLGSGA